METNPKFDEDCTLLSHNFVYFKSSVFLKWNLVMQIHNVIFFYNLEMGNVVHLIWWPPDLHTFDTKPSLPFS